MNKTWMALHHRISKLEGVKPPKLSKERMKFQAHLKTLSVPLITSTMYLTAGETSFKEEANLKKPLAQCIQEMPPEIYQASKEIIENPQKDPYLYEFFVKQIVCQKESLNYEDAETLLRTLYGLEEKKLNHRLMEKPKSQLIEG